MSQLDVFCERCGTRQPADPPRPGSRFSRILDAVGLTVPDSPQHEPYLRLCFTCRGYSCPACWNDAEGACQTCEPLPEPVAVAAPEPVYSAAAEDHHATLDQEPTLATMDTEAVQMRALPMTPAELPAEPEVEREWVAAADFEPAPEMAVDPEPEVDYLLEPEIEPELEPELEPEPEPEPESAPNFTAEVQPESAVVPEAQPEPQPVALAEVEVEAEPEAEPQPEPEIEYQPAPVPPPLPLSPLLPGNLFGPGRPVSPPPVRPRIEFEAPPPPPAFMIDRQTRAPLLPPPVSRAAMEAAQALPRTKHCSQCQLPLSATANFCRRCGSSQSA